MGRACVVVVVLAGLLSACGGGSSGGAQTRTVLVDYSLDEFPASYYGYYPRVVEATPATPSTSTRVGPATRTR